MTQEHIDYRNLSKEDLKSLLITCDYKGKEVKQNALDELLTRAYNEGHSTAQVVYVDKHYNP